MNYTVYMLKNCKISTYKIKKMLKYFTEDYTATEASSLSKLNIKTVNRYYNIFREIILQTVIDLLRTKPELGKCIGYIKGEYGPKCYHKIYKINAKTFILTSLPEKPKRAKDATRDKDFNNYLGFIYSRLKKFNGFTQQSHSYQLLECMVKYSHEKEDLYNLIWDYLKNDKL